MSECTRWLWIMASAVSRTGARELPPTRAITGSVDKGELPSSLSRPTYMGLLYLIKKRKISISVGHFPVGLNRSVQYTLSSLIRGSITHMCASCCTGWRKTINCLIIFRLHPRICCYKRRFSEDSIIARAVRISTHFNESDALVRRAL